jgi:hypothetical protein
MKSVRDFFWFCSGASRPILTRCPSESEKYAGIGATVFFTGVFASLSAGYALYTVFDNDWIAASFGLLWGTMIFNLDRYIVSSMGKKDRFWPEFKLLLPRLTLAVLLALVISKPLELKIFEKEINRKLDVKKSDEALLTKQAIRKGQPELDELDAKIAAAKQELIEKRSYRDQKQQEYDFERFGTKTPGTTGIAGLGTNARKKEQQLNEAQDDLKQTEARIRSEIAALETRRMEVRRDGEEAFAVQKINIDAYDGLAARIDALSVLTAESQAMQYANLFLILLFISIEIAPIFMKFLTSRGPYDELLEAHEGEVKRYKEERVAKSTWSGEARLLRFHDREKSQAEEQVAREQSIRKRFSEAEEAILDELVQHWIEEEKGKLNRSRMGW